MSGGAGCCEMLAEEVVTVGDVGLKLFHDGLVGDHHAQESAGAFELHAFGHQGLLGAFIAEAELVGPMAEGAAELGQGDPIVFGEVEDFIDEFNPHPVSADPELQIAANREDFGNFVLEITGRGSQQVDDIGGTPDVVEDFTACPGELNFGLKLLHVPQSFVAIAGRCELSAAWPGATGWYYF